MIDQKVVATIERARLYWALFMVVAVFVAIMLIWQNVTPWWSVFFLIPIGVITYFTTLTVTLVYLTVVKTREIDELAQSKLVELETRLKDGTLSPGPELMSELQAAGLAGVIEPVELPASPIGTFNGQPIYEWVDHYNVTTKQKERFYFYGSAASELDVPKAPDKTFINLKGILYVRDRAK